jgi:ABC-2 type transport system ATP-binding protein
MVLSVHNLSKHYGPQAALHGVSLSAGVGITALLGPNGSGKSTLLRLLATVAPLDGGSISFGGREYATAMQQVRATLGYLPQHLELPGDLTPRRLLRYLASLKNLANIRQTEELLTALGLVQLADRQLDRLSGGELRRVGLAQALLGNPRLLLLDEPLVGLDVAERQQVLWRLRQHATGAVVLFSSHVAQEAEALASQVLVLRAGGIIASGSVGELCAQAGHVSEVCIAAAAVEETMQRCVVSRVAREENQATLRIVGPLPPGLLGTPVPPTLEDAYLALQR